MRSKGDAELAFIGDSITQGWEGRGKDVWEKYYGDRKAINLGIGGDRTEHVIWRLTHGNLGKIKPKVAVLMIGTNNTGHFDQDPAEVAAGVERILEILERAFAGDQGCFAWDFSSRCRLAGCQTAKQHCDQPKDPQAC